MKWGTEGVGSKKRGIWGIINREHGLPPLLLDCIFRRGLQGYASNVLYGARTSRPRRRAGSHYVVEQSENEIILTRAAHTL